MGACNSTRAGVGRKLATTIQSTIYYVVAIIVVEGTKVKELRSMEHIGINLLIEYDILSTSSSIRKKPLVIHQLVSKFNHGQSHYMHGIISDIGLQLEHGHEGSDFR